jgi:pantetheine-phosphate adenylyltransferase
LVDHLVVALASNPEKKPCLSEAQRLALLRELCGEFANVSVDVYSGATVKYALTQQCTVLIRGLRTAIDLDAESGIAHINRQHGLDSLFLLADVQHVHLSSRLVKQVVAAGLPVEGLVAASVAAALSKPAGG